MKLNRRYTRSIRANLAFYISASVLTMVTLLLFYLFYIAGTGINAYGDSFFETYRVEDANFATYQQIGDEEIRALEERYGVTLEKERFANVDDGAYHERVFRPNEKIDLYQVQEGSDLSADDEVLLSAGYAEENGVRPGDKIQIHGKQYTVAGTFLRPDYLYLLENLTDDYKNVSTFFLAYMTPEEFDAQFGDGTVNYKVIYGADTDQEDFRLAINDAYYMASYLPAQANTRITFVHEQADMFLLMAWVMLVVMPFITVALISVLIGRKIRSEQKLIGTLSALGYEKGKLMRHYSLFAAIPGIVGGVLTAAAALALAEPFGRFGLADYEPMRPAFSLPLWVAVAGILIPTLIYWGCAMLRVRRLLKKDTVQLLGGQVGNDGKNHRILVKSGMKVRQKYALRTLAANPGRSFVIFLGIFLGAMIVAFAFSFIDSVKAVGDQAHGEFGTFRYEYILNSLQQEASEQGEEMTVLAYEDDNAVRFSLMGLDPDATLWNLQTTDGKRADLEKGYYISTLAAAMYDLKAGDTFTFRNIATLESYSVTVSGVIKNGYQSYLLSSRENVAEITGLDAKAYNAVLTDEALDIDSDLVTEVITSDTYHNQMENLLKSMGAVIYALMVIGVIICIASLYATVNMMLSENSHNISMLKVLGYDNRRINAMVIRANHLLLIPGIVLGIAAAYGIMVWYCREFVEVERIMIPATLRTGSVLLTAAITAACYFLSLLLLRRKVDQTDMIQALKDNRE